MAHRQGQVSWHIRLFLSFDLLRIPSEGVCDQIPLLLLQISADVSER